MHMFLAASVQLDLCAWSTGSLDHTATDAGDYARIRWPRQRGVQQVVAVTLSCTCAVMLYAASPCHCSYVLHYSLLRCAATATVALCSSMGVQYPLLCRGGSCRSFNKLQSTTLREYGTHNDPRECQPRSSRLLRICPATCHTGRRHSGIAEHRNVFVCMYGKLLMMCLAYLWRCINSLQVW